MNISEPSTSELKFQQISFGFTVFIQEQAKDNKLKLSQNSTKRTHHLKVILPWKS